MKNFPHLVNVNTKNSVPFILHLKLRMPPTSTAVVNQPLASANSVLDDTGLVAWLQPRNGSRLTVAYAYAKHRCKFFEVGSGDSVMICADPGKSSLTELKRFANSGRLKRIELPEDELDNSRISSSDWTLIDVTEDDVKRWYKFRESLFDQGRGKAISTSTAAKVWHAAGGRCMYRGCGQDLGQTPLTTKTARIAYLAHIVASDPDGPRGNAQSHALSDNHENIMLMCDAHHRLIDRIDEAGHTIDRLRAMREEHARRVNYLLEGMTYPRAQLITLLADLGQVPTNASQTELQESALHRRLGPLSNTLHALRRTQRDDRSRQDFWWHFLHEHENDIRSFVLQTGNHPSQDHAPPDVLAIFPLHLVPVLVMAGRIIGEARHVEVFQYDRDRRTWRWDESASPSGQGNISISSVPSTPVDEVVLSIELTADIDERALPPALVSAIHNQSMPWIRITHASPNCNCIRTPEDLDQFTTVARQAIRVIQDQIRASRVHLIGVSPASTMFRFGQMLQAGHHPLYQLYDRPDGAHQFLPALTLSGTQVVADSASGTPSFAISLR